MHESNDPAADAADAPSGRPSADASEEFGALEAEERRSLAREVHALALQRGTPIGANLGVILADLMGFAHTLAPLIQADLDRGAAASESGERWRRNADMYLRFVRQLERIVRLQPKPAAPPGPAAMR